MPIYEFRCQKCSTLFEVLMKSTDTGEVVCRNCGSTEIKKVISAAGYRLSSAGSGKNLSGTPSGCSSGSGFS